MAIKTQGTELWAVHPITHELLDLGCVTSIDGIDSTLAQIDVTCLRDLAREYESGLAEPGQASFEIQFDPENPDHIKLHDIKKAGTTLNWFVGLRESVDGVPKVPGTPPEVDPVSGEVDLPDVRSWIIFRGYMANFPFGFAQNDVVRSGIQVQISGDPEVIPKVATP